MMISTVHARAQDILAALKLDAASSAASGRYLRSQPFAPGARYWSTSQPRLRQDFVGVQFYGVGIERAAQWQARLEQAGFRKRTPQASQLTFAKSVPFSRDGGLDVLAIQAARAQVDAILGGAATAPNAVSLRQLMLASPLSAAEIVLPSRTASWRPDPL